MTVKNFVKMVLHAFILMNIVNISTFAQSPFRWTFNVNNPSYNPSTRIGNKSSPSIGIDGTVYFGASEGFIYAINNGASKWMYQVNGDILSSTTLSNDGQTVYFSSTGGCSAGADGCLFAIDSSGHKKWDLNIGNNYDPSNISSSPAIGSDGTIYIGSTNNRLYAITDNGNSGFMKWSFDAQAPIISSPSIGSDGTIYIGANSLLYAINKDGAKRWSTSIPAYSGSSPAIGVNDTLYIGAGSFLFSINPTTGDILWKVLLQVDSPLGPLQGLIISSPSLGSDGTIYVGNDNRYLFAVTSKGAIKWHSGYLLGPVTSSPAIGDDSTVYIEAAGTLYFISPADGSTLSSINLGGSLVGTNTESSPAIGPDGTVYIGTYGSTVYAVNTSSHGLANSSWPMFRHDMKHTGRVPQRATSPANASDMVIKILQDDDNRKRQTP